LPSSLSRFARSTASSSGMEAPSFETNRRSFVLESRRAGWLVWKVSIASRSALAIGLAEHSVFSRRSAFVERNAAGERNKEGEEEQAGPALAPCFLPRHPRSSLLPLILRIFIRSADYRWSREGRNTFNPVEQLKTCCSGSKHPFTARVR